LTQLLTLDDVAKQLTVCSKTARKLIPSVRIGRCLRFKQEDVDRYVQEHTFNPRPTAPAPRRRRSHIEPPLSTGIISLKELLALRKAAERKHEPTEKIDGTKQYRGKGGRFIGSAMGMPRPDED